MITGAVGGPMGAAAFFKIKSILASNAAKQRAALNVAGDGGGAPPNPLKVDSISRSGDRRVLNQGQAPTCGHNACGMVLDTLGKNVDVEALIKKIPPGKDGIVSESVARLMTSEGVEASALYERNVNDLARYTSKGTPVVVRIVDGSGSTSFSHFVVVDGITEINKIPVVAIRDSHNTQYFSPVSTFQQNFTGEVVVPRSVFK